MSEAKGDTVLLTLEAGILKRLELKPDDRAEKNLLQFHKKIIITECVGVFDLPRLMITGTHM